ncbi:hypothetical protein J2782_004492 [Brucella pseudogrignonensis]|uniref:Uncharacterized protein n=1 Tax=Brucella pseudogrignonensis TaxID=419475 RepID=A0ABU1MFB9_9HYPH|nr:hypothetical protein [Brucella pseudogrignonensis]
MGLKALELSPDPSPEFLIDVISQSGQGRTAVPTIVSNPAPKKWIELFGYFGQRSRRLPRDVQAFDRRQH